MLTTIKNAWKIAEVRKKIIFTLLMLVVFRLAAHIPVPGISKDALTELFKADIWTLMDTFSGGSLKYFTVCAMGIMPYINASIIMNLLTIAIPYFENLAREGQEGRKKMARITRYGAVGLALIQSIGMTFMIRSALVSTSVFSYMVIILTLTAGTCFLMWLGELITENGIGNGISLIIFVGILASLPNTLFTITESVRGGQTNIITVILFVPGTVRQAYGRTPCIRRSGFAHPDEGKSDRCYPDHFCHVAVDAAQHYRRFLPEQRLCHHAGRLVYARQLVVYYAVYFPYYILHIFLHRCYL